ncbi:MAG: nucleotidyltransferase family protein [Bacteroidales bacterium]|nr:nucleotidyltransferase family protein [Bacteroidales bacterium]
MKCIILAAGYATRLYPLTENFPKPLLKVGDRTIMDRLVDDISASGTVDRFIVVSNHKFAGHFKDWALCRSEAISILDDGTSSNDTRLGAVRDIRFAIDSLHLEDDLLIIAGDNLLDFSILSFLHYAESKKTSCIMRYPETDTARLRKSGVVTVDENDLILRMEEKPAVPESRWCCPPFYFYTRQDAARIGEAVDSGCPVDTPGSLAVWLSSRTAVHAMEMPGRRYDIGNLESYREVQKHFTGSPEQANVNSLYLPAQRQQ